jgi:hypothetical protein
MRRRAAVIGLFLAASALGFAQGPARMSEMRTSRSVDPKIQSPINPSATFGLQPVPIFITARIADAPAATKARIAAVYLEGAAKQVAVYDYPNLNGSGYISFKLSPPPSGWPKGKYRAEFFLDGAFRGSIGFTLVDLPESATQLFYRTFVDRKSGFSVAYPAGWVKGADDSPSVACLYLANPNNNPLASLNVQVVPVTGVQPGQEKEAVALVAKQLIDQVWTGGQARIRSDQWVQAGDKQGRELDFDYQFQGRSVRQTQFLTYHADKVFIVILTVDPKLYAAYSDHFLHATQSLTWLDQ